MSPSSATSVAARNSSGWGTFVSQVLRDRDRFFAEVTLLHVLGAGLLGMAVLHDGLAFACEKRGIHPKKAR